MNSVEQLHPLEVRVLCAAAGEAPFTAADLMAAAGLGRATYTPREPRGPRSESAEAAVTFLVEAGGDIHASNEADFMALHGAAFRGLNEVIDYLVEQGAEGSKQSCQFQSWPETAEFLADLGADTTLGIPGTVQERLRDTSPEELLEDVNEP